jgi:hypothetical protein
MTSDLTFFTSPRVRGEVDTPKRSAGVSGEGAFQALSPSKLPLTRLAPSALGTLSPQAGRGKKGPRHEL